MQKDLVFFKKEGEEGVALTSTSANHIANMAKEYIHPDGVLSDERKKLKHTLHIKMAEELRAKAEKGEATASDAMAALMLAAIMKKESKED